ncbi:MAG TPA: P1 family peptidase [Bryobacteraceae bacterium]|nr:P1 family peptidase [Bryobacteraceae bacterium]
MKGLTDIPGIRVGHSSDYDALTGCTVILCEDGAVAGYDIRGGATGTEEFEVMSPLHVTDHIHALVFAGGSAFGLEAASGVRRYLEQKGIGYTTRAAKVPLVPCAILYDLTIGKAGVRPTREMGEAAAAAAHTGVVEEGAVGAGTGATTGKIFGIARAMKSGLGTFTVALGGSHTDVLVSSLTVVNAYGDVIDPQTGKLLAGARASEESLELVGTAAAMKAVRQAPARHENTTLAVVATNARLSKVQATRLAQLASVGIARTISPVWTSYDGDLVVALSTGTRDADVNALGVAAVEAVAESVQRAVRLSPGLGGLPGLASARPGGLR